MRRHKEAFFAQVSLIGGRGSLSDLGQLASHGAQTFPNTLCGTVLDASAAVEAAAALANNLSGTTCSELRQTRTPLPPLLSL